MRILITSGPTRQYLDPVRFLTNGSSGRMGRALTEAAIRAGHEVVVVSGPVEIKYPRQAEVVPVVTTEDMLDACLKMFPRCDGLIAVAAPCDYRTKVVAPHKIRKTGKPLEVQLIETPDVVARLAAIKKRQWMVAFALETEDRHFRAMQKLERKKCDLIVVNSPAAMHTSHTSVEVIDAAGRVLATIAGSKTRVARALLQTIEASVSNPANPRERPS